MQIIRPDVSTICIGMAASMGTVLLSAGTKGKRFALPNATIHMHQAVGGAQGQASDIEIAAREIMRLQDLLRHVLSKHTGQTVEKITHDTDRDFYLNPEQAVEYGLVDEILKPMKKEKEKEKESKKA
jgi:ATP-dependent Clp protease protease subunit